MRKISITHKAISITFTSVFLFLILPSAMLTANESRDRYLIEVEDFSRFHTGTFPEGWVSKGGDAEKVYHVKSDGEYYLEARSEDAAVAIAKKIKYNLRQYPVLSWQWRAVELPSGGDERFKQTGDSAAGVYVIFSGFMPKIIKYAWSASLPVGTHTKSPYHSKTKIVVLRNQSSPMHTWISEEVNVYEDYERLFGTKPGQVRAIGIMTDSDNTHTLASAHYKNLAVKEE